MVAPSHKLLCTYAAFKLNHQHSFFCYTVDDADVFSYTQQNKYITFPWLFKCSFYLFHFIIKFIIFLNVKLQWLYSLHKFGRTSVQNVEKLLFLFLELSPKLDCSDITCCLVLFFCTKPASGCYDWHSIPSLKFLFLWFICFV